MKQLSPFLIILLLTINGQAQFGQQNKNHTWGMGFQTTYPFSGISLKVNFSKYFGIQGMFGLEANNSQSSIRTLFRYPVNQEHELYIVAQAGKYYYEGISFGDIDLIKAEEIFGYGFGFGTEYNTGNLIKDLPLWFNLEVVYGKLDFKNVIFENKEITFGAGLHYYFK